MRDAYDIVIVGAGHGGAQTAIALRQRKFEGSIALIGDESEHPYERPPLSKEYLSGEKTFDQIMIRPPAFYAEREIEVQTGQRIVAVSAAKHTVSTADGRSVGYKQLIWATGGTPRRLTCSGHDLAGVHTVRTRADVDRMTTELGAVSRVCVIGGGYIGLEAAAVLRKLGKEVVLIEALDRVLARVAGAALSRFYEDQHRAHGVDIRLNASVDCIEGASGLVSGVRMVGGATVACQMVIVGIGVIPAVEPLLAAGAVGDNGVRVDHLCRTSLDDVFAIGDCAAHQSEFADGRVIRLESVQNASDMALTVAKAITGAPEAYEAVPWFWSNQYDLRLQTIGLSIGHDEAITRGDPNSGSFSIVYLRRGRVVALDCVNATKDYVQGKKLIVGRQEIAAEKLANASIALKDFA